MSSPRKDLSKWVVDETDAMPVNSQKSSNDLSGWQVAEDEKSLAPENLSRQQLEAIGNDSFLQRPINRLGEDALSLVKNLWGTVTGGVPATINELAENPVHAARQFAAGVGTIPITMANAAFNIPQWLAHLESEKASNAMKKYTPQLPTEMYQNLIGGENPNAEDIQVRNLGQLTPIGIPLGKGVARGVGTAIKTGKEAFANTEPYESAVNQAKQEAEEAKTQAEVPKPGMYANPKTDLESTEAQIGKYINAEADHRVRVARQLTNRVNDIQDFWSDAYKNFEDKVRDAKFQMPESAMQNLDYANIDPSKLIQTYGADAFEAIKQGKMEDFVKKMQEKEAPENPYYKKLLDVAPTAQDTSAADFLLKRRAFRDALYDLKQKIHNDKFAPLEEDVARKAATQGDQMMAQIDKTLSEGLGEYKPEFDWINNGYSEQVYPIRGNKFVETEKGRLKIKKLPNNIIDAFSTDEDGMNILRNLVKQDPEVLKNVIGQRYVAKPSEVHVPNEQMREYLDELPEFKNMLANRESVLETTANRKDVSLKKHIEAVNKLKAIKNARSKARVKLLTAGMSAAIPYGYRKVSNLFVK